MPRQVDWMRGLTSGFLAGIVGGLAMTALTITLLAVIGFAVTSELFMQLINIVAYVAWPIGGASLWGCLLGVLYASNHKDRPEASSIKDGWIYGAIYGAIFSFSQLPWGWLPLWAVAAEVAVLYYVSVLLLSVFLFGTLLVVFWRKKLYFHGYWGMK